MFPCVWRYQLRHKFTLATGGKMVVLLHYKRKPTLKIYIEPNVDFLANSRSLGTKIDITFFSMDNFLSVLQFNDL